MTYNISHINLNENLLLPVREHDSFGLYMVFWWKDFPLGDLYIKPSEKISEELLYEKLISAITPPVSFYQNSSKLSPELEWQDLVRTRNQTGWNNFMQDVLESWIDKEIPAKVPISVVICTRNRAVQLRKCLKLLSSLQSVPEEIIVVDNAPDNNSTEQVARSFDNVKYVLEPRVGLDIARNTGIRNSKESIVAYVDDDVVVHPLWAFHVWKTFEDPLTCAMTGLVFAAELQTEAQLIFEKCWSFNRGYVDKIYDSHFFQKTLSQGPPVWDIGAGANMAFRKSVFDETGVFDELLDVGAAGCNGDSEMWYRILSKGYKIQYNPRAIAFHEHRKEIEGLKKQLFYYMRGYTVAALIQQKLLPESGYKRSLLTKMPVYYFWLFVQGFPKFEFRHQTLWVELKGIISGWVFFYKNRRQIINRSKK